MGQRGHYPDSLPPFLPVEREGHQGDEYKATHDAELDPTLQLHTEESTPCERVRRHQFWAGGAVIVTSRSHNEKIEQHNRYEKGPD